MARPKTATFDKKKTVAENRRARFDYHVEDVFEAGIMLTGTEVKSLRFGEGSIAESYAEIRKGECWLVNSNVPEFSHGNRHNHEPKRPRKLLLHARDRAPARGGRAQGDDAGAAVDLFQQPGPRESRTGAGQGQECGGQAPDDQGSRLEARARPYYARSPMNPLISRLTAWLHRSMPKREDMERNRLSAPFARRQELWRFTRRSVPRGVAIGLLVGIFAMIPGVQIIGAALMCVPFRGNIPLAAGMTFLSNPATTPFILAASIWVGNSIGYHADVTTFYGLYASGASLGTWTNWLLSDAAPALLVGLLLIATACSVAGFFISAVVWRWWVGRKRRTNLERSGKSGIKP
jgi:tmRNA-binding protein/uncharacterized protein (DUF2062 family)